MDLIILFNTFFGFLTFIAWVSTAAMLYLYFSKKTFSKLITDQFLNFAISVAVFSSIGSIVYSEVVGFIPCRFCWYQRYLMYPIAIALIISLFKRPFFRAGYISCCFFFYRKYCLFGGCWFYPLSILLVSKIFNVSSGNSLSYFSI